MRCGLPERLECVNKGEEIIFSRSRRSGCDRKVAQRLSEQTSEIPVNKKFRHFPSRGCGSKINYLRDETQTPIAKVFQLTQGKNFLRHKTHRLDKFRVPEVK